MSGTSRRGPFGTLVASIVFLACAAGQVAAADSSDKFNAKEMAKQVTIYRDSYGMPHIDGKTDAAVLFGFGYCQAEDYFWQIEESYVMGLGRSAELYGNSFLAKDKRNRAFEVPQRSKEDFDKLDPRAQELGYAFIGGINYYLDTHPEVKPRLLTRFEPWYILSFARSAMLELVGSHMHVGTDKVPTAYESKLKEKIESEVKAATGSNAWAISGSKTRSGRPMLLINPHQPYYGFGQFYEAHLKSGEGWNFTGAAFFGTPMPALGHNESCGWAFTTNEPSCGSSWREVFDDPSEPLNYRYGKEYRKAVEWTDTIKVKKGKEFETVKCTFRKTHHGPILQKNSDTEYVSGMVARLYDAVLSRQSMKMVRAKNLNEFKDAMSMLDLPLFNTVYADVHGDIYYLYNGIVPKRDAQFDWEKPVDGTDSRTEWQGIHPIADLPQVVNPASGYVQNCNSTPYTTCDDSNPFIGDYPKYMVEDRYDDKKRAKVSRMLLRQAKDLTLDSWQELSFDTTIYWALTELPRYKAEHAKLKETDPNLAAKVAPYLEHLLDWDCKGTVDSTQATLSTAWYEELYGFGYPAETLKPKFVSNVPEQFKALITAADKLKNIYGNWKMPYGEVNRLQRHANVSDFLQIPFADGFASLPSTGLPGPPGTVFTMYFTPTIDFPGKAMKKHYAVVGTSFMSVVEFTDRVQSRSLLQYGSSGDPKSPHFFDQAELISKRKLKDNLFYWEDVEAKAKNVYHPGEQSKAPAAKAAAKGDTQAAN